MPLADDEYTCLMIMAEGQNLIRMRNTRWYDALNNLEAKDFCKPVGNENFVITQRATAALAGHEETLNGDLRKVIMAHGRINEQRQAMHAKMQEALSAVLAGVEIAALTTGKTKEFCLGELLHEIKIRAEEKLGRY